MSDYTESELYSIFANVGYEINQGKTLEEIEQEIKQDYGLDIKLDKELSDEFGAIIKYRDEIIHSIRGTQSFTDGITDVELAIAHPYYGSILTTFLAGLGTFKVAKDLINYNQGNYDDPNFFRNTATRFANDYYEAREEMLVRYHKRLPDLEDGLADMRPDEVKDEIRRLSFLEKRKGVKDYNQMKNNVKNMIKWWTLPHIIFQVNKHFFKITLKDDRINREFKRFDNAKAKYPNLKMSLTGHSLGSIANDIGRTHNVKSITFNPAPMEHNSAQPHKDSKIYRMENDIISFFLTDNDNEDTQHIPKHPWYYNLDTDLFKKVHSLDNFLPKRRRLSSSTPRPIPSLLSPPTPPPPPQKVHNRLKFIIKDDVLTRERPIIKIMNEYSAMIEDSLEEFLPNYQQQELGFIHKNKFKHKLKKKYIFSI